MTLLVIVYALNGTLLLLHEIESAFEKEWELLRLPGGITGFLAFHVPIVLLLFYGLIESHKGSTTGTVLGLVFALGGTMPFIVHELLLRHRDHFNRIGSRIIVYLNLAAGIVLFIITVFALFHEK